MNVQSTWFSIQFFQNYYPFPLKQGYTLPFLLLPIAPIPNSLSLSSFLALLPYFFVFSPITEAYHSAYQFVSQAGFTEHVVTRAEYAEYGSNASRKKFRDWKPQESEKEKQ